MWKLPSFNGHTAYDITAMIASKEENQTCPHSRIESCILLAFSYTLDITHNFKAEIAC